MCACQTSSQFSRSGVCGGQTLKLCASRRRRRGGVVRWWLIVGLFVWKHKWELNPEVCSDYSSYYDRVWRYLCVQKSFANWRRSSLQPGSSYTGQPQTALTGRRHTFLSLMKCLYVLNIVVIDLFQSWVVISGWIKPLITTDLGYSDGVGPKWQCVFVVAAQELHVFRLFLDAGMLEKEYRASRDVKGTVPWFK